MKTHRIIVLAALFAAPLLAEENWSRFRGPNGTGVSSATTIPAQWTEKDHRWKIELPGSGHSSPVVIGDRLYVTCTDPTTAEQSLISIRAGNGAVAWRYRLESKPYRLHQFNSFASASPAADERHVYVPVSSESRYQLVALTHEGKDAWRYDMGKFDSQHGSGASPIVYQDVVVMANDQDGESFIVALDARYGKERWKTPRKAGRAAYGTPCVYKGADGKEQLLFSSAASGLSGLDPATGKVLWEVNDVYPLRAVCSPVVVGDLVVGTCGEGGGGKRLVAVKPGSFDGKTPAKLVYDMKEKLPYVPTPLFVNNLMFLINDGGIASCVNPATGEVKWQERIAPKAFFASPVCANGIIYCVSRDGEVVTFKATDKFEPTGTSSLGEASHATPAIARGSMFLRTEKHLIKIGE